MSLDVYLAVDAAKLDASVAAFDRLTGEAQQLRENGFHLSAEGAEKLARAKYLEPVDLTKPPRVMWSDAAGSPYDIPEIDLVQFGRWLDTSASPAAIGDVHLADAQRVVTAMNRSLIAAGADERNDAADELAAALCQGLEQRVGTYLSDVERGVYLTIRSLSSIGKRPCVCENCWIVFRGRTASTCLTCRRNPSRATPQPWHHETIPGDRRHEITSRTWITDHKVTRQATIRRSGTPTRTSYRTTCVACGQEFTAVDARDRFCLRHGRSPNVTRAHA